MEAYYNPQFIYWLYCFVSVLCFVLPISIHLLNILLASFFFWFPTFLCLPLPLLSFSPSPPSFSLSLLWFSLSLGKFSLSLFPFLSQVHFPNRTFSTYFNLMCPPFQQTDQAIFRSLLSQFSFWESHPSSRFVSCLNCLSYKCSSFTVLDIVLFLQVQFFHNFRYSSLKQTFQVQSFGDSVKCLGIEIFFTELKFSLNRGKILREAYGPLLGISSLNRRFHWIVVYWITEWLYSKRTSGRDWKTR